eukprot:CAMPEP_0119284466 /NCGR_PEP_ID=MMETSP1329-20130426/30352_1 /TAXON_ID=114041 /ORGANISM="Genus nov. species nov., Strain RCC1024" /LENGTH=164 /DNA_ID=CAMNT_0007285145 /DNA_START=311 /DNA_END=802 /DNA_ORIENTATION=-
MQRPGAVPPLCETNRIAAYARSVRAPADVASVLDNAHALVCRAWRDSLRTVPDAVAVVEEHQLFLVTSLAAIKSPPSPGEMSKVEEKEKSQALLSLKIEHAHQFRDHYQRERKAGRSSREAMELATEAAGRLDHPSWKTQWARFPVLAEAFRARLDWLDRETAI